MTHNQYLVLVAAAPIENVLLLCVLFVRRRAASFPFYTLWIALDAVIITAIPYAYFHCPISTTTNIFWTLWLLDTAVQLLVVYEICMRIFRPTGELAHDIRSALLYLVSGSIGVACVLAFLVHPLSSMPVYAFMQRVRVFYLTLISELLVGMLVLSSITGRSSKTHAARIAQVYSIASLTELLFEIVRNSLSHAWMVQIYRLLLYSQNFLDLAWGIALLVLLWRDEPTPQKLPDHLRTQIYTLHQQAENDLIRIRSWRNN